MKHVIAFVLNADVGGLQVLEPVQRTINALGSVLEILTIFPRIEVAAVCARDIDRLKLVLV